MAGLNLKGAEVVLLEENFDSRVLVKSALRGMGCTSVHECRNVEGVRRRFRYFQVDLLMLDLDVDFDAACQLIRDIRYQRLGFSWFVVIVGLTWRPMGDVIETALAAGMDDLVKKPLTNKILTERITNLIRNRKAFVAGPDYIGPKRAKGPGGEAAPVAHAPAVEVPNSLRRKVTGEGKAVDDSLETRRVIEEMNRKRLHSLTLELGALSGSLVARFKGAEAVFGVDVELGRLAGLTAQITHLATYEIVKNLPKLASSMAAAMDAIMLATPPLPRQIELFHLHAQAIAAALRGDDGAVDDVAHALNQAVERTRAAAPESSREATGGGASGSR